MLKRVMVMMLAAAWVVGCSTDEPAPTAEPDSGVEQDGGEDDAGDDADAHDEVDVEEDADADGDADVEDGGGEESGVVLSAAPASYAYRVGEEAVGAGEVFLKVDATLENVGVTSEVGMVVEGFALEITTTEGEAQVEALTLGASLEGGCAAESPEALAAPGETVSCTALFAIPNGATALWLRYEDPATFEGALAAITMPGEAPVTVGMLDEARQTYGEGVAAVTQASCECDSEPFSSVEECVEVFSHDMSGCEEVVLNDRGEMLEAITCLNGFLPQEEACYASCGAATQCVAGLDYQGCWELLDEPLRTALRGC
ncbi:hypothetical protein DL240_15325 [Lujinxingia litoralis]|uniref:DUF4352 domain-containing protein n=1 Tax=Lujinxingia litoralis TaxID=2211119 RepID=A0A328C2M3_9DELT|nr:hypothetical protein [Lujinxingia litoralis]RAL20687.1 hypothetical protein DL240_15325 [Lujinxingia litoralis]